LTADPPAAESPALHSADEAVDYKAIALLSAAHLSDDVNQGVIPAMLPFFIATNHLSYAAAAGLVLAQTLSASVMQPLFGMMADRRPAPWLIPAGLSLAGIGVALSGIAPNYGLIFAAIALSGLGISAFHPEAARRVRYLSATRQATTMSLFTVGGMVGFAIGPLFITPTLIAFGTRGALILAMPVLIMATAVSWRLPHLSATTGARHSRGGAHVIAEAPERWADFIRLTAVVIFRSIVFFGLNTFIPLYWTRVLHGSTAGAAYALTTMLSAVAIGTLVGGRLADSHGRRIVIVVSLAVVVPLILMLLGSANRLAVGLLLVPVGLVLAASNSVVVVMAQEYLPNRVGLAAGVTLGLSMTIGGLAMPLFGVIADHYGLSRALFLLAFLPAIGFALSLGLHESTGGTSNEVLAPPAPAVIATRAS
jgi:FSR family fosmidomycin resistance protein-like MFS transporter